MKREKTPLIAKMKLNQSSAELAMVSLKKERQGVVGGDFTWVSVYSTHYEGLQLSVKGLAATE